MIYKERHDEPLYIAYMTENAYKDNSFFLVHNNAFRNAMTNCILGELKMSLPNKVETTYRAHRVILHAYQDWPLPQTKRPLQCHQALS